ncbi:TIGR03619 family F420-dependent LLM class oxidoreductase [Sphingomonas bacterium]|uniref:TIGR03619 family F420-dependent LLM class oxidoreductase n=1 Tax=Sphingomonas bacterium TaxID=1895847 RepID=UPI0015755F4F|nr:TIGR03619 family F420-dependent LLM class oxidoreductase [Sphingomonas bacterium]
MRFSCSLPIDDVGNGEFLTVEAITEMVQAIDKAGLDATFVTDHPAPSGRWVENGGHATLDPFVALSVAAAASPRIRLHTHILVLAYRNPFIVAKAAASLDALSGGRFTMGIGTGYLRPEYAAVGVSFEDRGAITDESIKVLRQAWTGNPVHHEGSRFEARDAVCLPTPKQKNGVPIWAGGNADRAIRRAVELCDGWCPFPVEGIVSKTARTDELANIGQLKEKLAYAQAHADSIGRTDPLTICMGRFGNSTMKPQDVGDASRAVEDYGELQEAGVSWSTVSVPSPSRKAFIENVQWFGEEIAAKVPKTA